MIIPSPGTSTTLAQSSIGVLVGRGVAPMVRLVLGLLGGDLGSRRGDQLLRRSVELELQPERLAAGAEDVLRCRDPAPGQRGQPLRRERGESLLTVVEMENHPVGRAEGAADRREYGIGGAPTEFG